jgi:membrane protease YdiL (CAAX protease family)
MIETKDIEIKWHAIGKSCLWMFLAFGAGFFILALLNQISGYKALVENSPWIPKSIGDSIAFAVGVFIIWKISRGRLKNYGFSLASKNLKIKLSLILGIFLGLIGIILDHLPELISGVQFKPSHPYPLTAVNILGMMTFQWIFVGIFEETITRGLMQTYLMEKLNGVVTLYKWDFHIGSIITAVLFGVGHFGPHLFFGGSWLTLIPHLLFATAFGLCSSYIYQETKSLVGPILMHNIIDGLLYSVDYLFY